MPHTLPSVLIVDDDARFARSAAEFARERGFEASVANSLAESRQLMADGRIDLTMLDIALPDGSAYQLIDELDGTARARVALMSDENEGDAAAQVERMRLFDHVVKPLCPERYGDLLARASDRDSPPVPLCGGLIGDCEAMRALSSTIRRIAPACVSVLVTGESGTGKELVARAIHECSHRRGAFVAVNCGAIAPELLASHLFGHERGSFTGAAQRHTGYFEQANRGTLFLDEITEMPPALQVYLLRALETGEVTRVGGIDPIPVDVRIVAACNRDPMQAIEQGRLREDLYYRLADFIMPLPPLRARGHDAVLLARAFVERLNAQHGERKRISPNSERVLRQYPWPGNVRELRSAVQRAFLVSDGPLIEIQPGARTGPVGPRVDDGAIVFRVGMSYADVEREMLLRTLEQVGHDKTQAARILGVSVRTIHNQLARIEPSR